jgi:carboxymethylenebutenolidase
LFRTVDLGKMQQDFLAAAAWLNSRPDSTGKLGAIGFCFGGGIVNALAVEMGAISPPPFPSTGSSPQPWTPPGSRRRYGELDSRITPGWPAFDAALTAAGVPHEGHIYKGANRGFHNDTTPRYDEAAAKEAWGRAIDWFNRYLRS